MSPSRTSGRLLLGTSGFGYDEWKGRFYPAGIKAKDMLAFYASQLSSVEINYTFRSLLTEKAVAAWTAATPETFVFALKAHMRMGAVKLDDVRKAGAMFAEAAAPLGARTGPVLLQIPKRLENDAAALEAYLDVLPKTLRFALEFTADGWDRVRSLVEARGMGRCVADTDEAPAPDDAAASGAFSYLRLRRTKYSAADLARWAERIGQALTAGRDVHCYFRHEDSASGPRFAEALAKAIEKRSGLAAGSRSRRG
jgi:uncharacterized protein YecE (DUF72 family)